MVNRWRRLPIPSGKASEDDVEALIAGLPFLDDVHVALRDKACKSLEERSVAVLETLVDVYGDRFEYETNMLLAMKTHNIAFDEVKIRTVYIEENKSSHFRAFRDSWRIYKLIFAHFFKYTLSSLLCSFVDEGLFIYLSHLLCNTLSGFLLTAVPILISRLISSVMNFFVNRRLVFHSHLNLRKAFFRYFSLVIPQGVLQLGITFGLYELFQISAQRTLVRGGVHALVMIALFFVSYTIQQRWVFSGTEEDQ